MHGQAALIERAPTEGDVLAYFRADYRIRCGVDPEVLAGEALTAETTVADWRLICDLASTHRLARALEAWFGGGPTAPLAAAAWRDVLEPEDHRTLGDVARLAAAHGRPWPDFAPLPVAGTRDAAAGAFFYLRAALIRAGAPAQGVRPSTALGPYLLRHFEPLADAVARVAPEVVPEPRVTWAPGRRAASTLAVALGLGASAAAAARASLAALAAGLALVVGGLWLARGAPQRLEFGPYATFGDLARAIARSRQAAA